MKYLKLMRIKHYFKNFLIFLPVIFSKNFFNLDCLVKTIVGFVVFSLVSSTIYILNDLRDVENDRLHPIKMNRPLANGSISKNNAIILMIILFITIISILFFNNSLFNKGSILLAVYFIINVLYSCGLKNIPLLDITILSFGFVIRVLYGGFIISIPVSNWLFLTILSSSFYMALGKRKNELKKLKDSKTRNVLKYYTKEYLEKNMYLFLTLSIVFYSLWSTLGVTVDSFKYSIIFVILILMKYNMNIEKDNFGDPVDVIISDKILISLIAIHAIFCFLALYVI